MKERLFLFLALILITGCSFTGMFGNEKEYELTETDIVSMMRNDEPLSSEQITVMGVRLGNSEEEVERLLGKADVRNTDYASEGIINVEYGSSLGLEDTGILIHFENNEATRITILKAFNEKLIGLTKLGKTKEEVYAYLGTPEKITRMVKGPRVEFKTFSYKNGVEILLKGGKVEDRLSFVKNKV